MVIEVDRNRVFFASCVVIRIQSDRWFDGGNWNIFVNKGETNLFDNPANGPSARDSSKSIKSLKVC